MAKYTTSTNMQTILVGTEFDTSTTALIDKMITHAENECDKYLSKRYDISQWIGVSLSTIPPLLTSLTETLTEGYFFFRNSRGGGKDQVDYGKELIKQAKENLQAIADRKMDLIEVDGTLVAQSANASYQLLSTTTNYTPTINEDDELNWKQDEDKLDAIESDRQ